MHYQRGARAILLSYGAIILFLWLPDVYREQGGKSPHYITHVGYVKVPQVTTYRDKAQAIGQAISALIARHPFIQTIVMPEATMQCALNEHSEIIEAWCGDSLGGRTLIVGAPLRTVKGD